ncbi:MAG: nucleotide-diphospho-sugar transferase [Bacteroidia bacterium]
MALQTPILFLIFNRPETTVKVFEQIALQKPSKLYIAADGPRKNKPNEDELCRQTREIVSKINWPCQVKTLYRDKNLGCKIAVSSAITWFFEHEEEGIILEDDCLPHADFFKFCEVSLQNYRYNYEVMHINGFCPITQSSNVRFTNYISIWGWATWRRAWKLYDVNAGYYNSFKKQQLLHKLFPKSYHLIKDFIKHVIDGKNNTWDLQWALAIHVFFGVALMPPVNLVKNIGFENATHSSENDKSRLTIESNSINIENLTFTKDFFVDNTLDDEINFYFNGRYSIFKKIKSTLFPNS